jgi:hypothetical protein
MNDDYAVHWSYVALSVLKAFCGRGGVRHVTTEKDRVTCQACVRLMRLYGHLEHDLVRSVAR